MMALDGVCLHGEIGVKVVVSFESLMTVAPNFSGWGVPARRDWRQGGCQSAAT
jgi:hypothetical protein